MQCAEAPLIVVEPSSLLTQVAADGGAHAFIAALQSEPRLGNGPRPRPSHPTERIVEPRAPEPVGASAVSDRMAALRDLQNRP